MEGSKKEDESSLGMSTLIPLMEGIFLEGTGKKLGMVEHKRTVYFYIYV